MDAPYIVTHGGRRVALLSPRPDDIAVDDIAHHLALVCRFGGATVHPYSVAQHSLLVADLLEMHHAPPGTVLAGLLHDAHEAYLGDVTGPLRRILDPLYAPLAERFDAAIAVALKLPPLAPADLRQIAEADAVALATEWRDLMPGDRPPTAAQPAHRHIGAMRWHEAKSRFHRRFTALFAPA